VIPEAAPAQARPPAILTGGSQGIGAAVLKRLGLAGYDCLVVGRTPPAQASAAFAAHDLSTDEGVAGAVEEIEEFLHGRCARVLINNAGGAMPCATLDLDVARLRSVLTLNLVAPIQLCRAVLPGMRRAGAGSIVNVASTAGRVGVPYLPSYSAAKAGLISFTQSLAAETASYGIRVNAVCPGAVNTELAREGRAMLSALHGLEANEYEQRMKNATGLGRLLNSDEVAAVIYWLATCLEHPVTGQAINVCGTIEMG
jgi:3-hydroxybutyrate dehydrogenase